MKKYRFSSGDEETSRRAEQQFLRITENMTDEERDAVLECLIKMQKQMFFLRFRWDMLTNHWLCDVFAYT